MSAADRLNRSQRLELRTAACFDMTELLEGLICDDGCIKKVCTTYPAPPFVRSLLSTADEFLCPPSRTGESAFTGNDTFWPLPRLSRSTSAFLLDITGRTKRVVSMKSANE